MKIFLNEVDPRTGEDSVTELHPKVVKEYCLDKDHYFEIKDGECKCVKCGLGKIINHGTMKLVEGKILRR